MPNLITQRYSDEELEQMRASLRDSLEKTDKGGTANSIRNCVIVFENDPLFAGKIIQKNVCKTPSGWWPALMAFIRSGTI